MCSLQEPFATVTVAADMRGVGGPLLGVGPSEDTIVASVSPSSVALLRPDDARPIRSWFTKPSTPFTTTAVWDSVHSKFVSASQEKVLAWANSEKVVPSFVVHCHSDVLCLLPYSAGVVVVCKNGLAFPLQYERPNWDVHMTPSVKGTYTWASLLEADGEVLILLRAEDGKSLLRFPLSDSSTITVIKTPAKFSVTTCCVHNSTLFVGNSQGKVLQLQGNALTASKIDLKLEAPDHLTALLSCDRDILVASQTKVSLWDVQFGLMKTSIEISFAPWPNKGLLVNGNKALFVHTSLMVLPVRMQKWSLAALAGSKKRKSEKKASACVDLCNSLANHVETWSLADMQKQLQKIDDLSETLIAKCWRRILAVDPTQQALITRLIMARHECRTLTSILHESMSLDEVQRSIDLLAGCMAGVTFAQLGSGVLEALMDWSCHLVDAHRNALRVSLRAESETTSACLLRLDQSLERIEGLSKDLQEGQYNLKVALDKTDRVTAPRERLYWVESWPLLSNKAG
ncbi:hypothetical protein BIW11_09694 [Tropilaelaps mercedesae]|uniref:Uncharacterized protein n=1 Tax=Tropilaelaps mercedesae TaxID=418985 RepID=A0A1V9XJG5_9ACAR|nr:hypothetical protein BIW11_09694 [Tropilaelaps mercedesae]